MKFKFNLQQFAEGDELDNTPVDGSDQIETPAESDTDDSQTDVEEEAKPNEYADLLSAINEKAVYKGEKMNITDFQEVIDAVQMKQNYAPTHDRMSKAESRVAELENSRQAKFMATFLKDNGFDNFESYEDALKVSELVDEGMTEERAQAYIEGQRSLNDSKAAKELSDKEANKESISTDNSVEAIDWYKDSGYGELTEDKITQETWDKVNNKGIPLKYALMEQMFGNIKSDTEQDVLKKLQNKKDSSVGSITNANDKQTKSFGDMSDTEFKKIQAQVESGTYKKTFRE